MYMLQQLKTLRESLLKVTNEPTSLPAPIQLAQNANCRHECLWPQDLDFTLAEDYFPEGFLQKDI